jgi:hypothetical protein
MFLLGTQGFRWNAPRSWPWMFYVWIVIIVAVYIPKLWRLWRQHSAKSWLPVSATIDSTHVDAGRFLQARRNCEKFRAEINYSYFVGGTTHTGQYSRMFYSDADALEFIRDLQGKSLTAQVRCTKPAQSLVFDSEIEHLIGARPVLSHEQIKSKNPDDPAQSWFAPYLPLFIFLAAVGFLVSLWVHVGALLGKIVAPPSFFWGLHVGIFLVFFPAILVATQITMTSNRKDGWKIALRFAPPWMLYVFYVLFPYTFFNFFRGFFLTAAPYTHGAPGVTEWRMFSGHWMLFYFSSLALLYSGIQSGTATGFCNNGHRFSSQYSTCPQCGEPTHYSAASENYSRG